MTISAILAGPIDEVIKPSTLECVADLGRELDLGPGPFAVQRDAVAERAGRAVRPAGAAVRGDVLVAVGSRIVDPAQVADIVRGGNVLGLHVRLRQGGGHQRHLEEAEGKKLRRL